jgi:hypothetical protein
LGTSSVFTHLACALRTIPRTDPDARPLAPKDASVFQVATQKLREDDSHAVDVRFYIRIEPIDDHWTDVPQPLTLACGLSWPQPSCTSVNLLDLCSSRGCRGHGEIYRSVAYIKVPFCWCSSSSSSFTTTTSSTDVAEEHWDVWGVLPHQVFSGVFFAHR